MVPRGTRILPPKCWLNPHWTHTPQEVSIFSPALQVLGWRCRYSVGSWWYVSSILLSGSEEKRMEAISQAIGARGDQSHCSVEGKWQTTWKHVTYLHLFQISIICISCVFTSDNICIYEDSTARPWPQSCLSHVQQSKRRNRTIRCPLLKTHAENCCHSLFELSELCCIFFPWKQTGLYIYIYHSYHCIYLCVVIIV